MRCSHWKNWILKNVISSLRWFSYLGLSEHILTWNRRKYINSSSVVLVLHIATVIRKYRQYLNSSKFCYYLCYSFLCLFNVEYTWCVCREAAVFQDTFNKAWLQQGMIWVKGDLKYDSFDCFREFPKNSDGWVVVQKEVFAKKKK